MTDLQIIGEIRDGKGHLYAVLVDRYKNLGFSLASRILRNREDAEEATQDAFIRAYNALNGFEGKSRFSTWFYRILYNVCLTKISRRKEELFSLDEESHSYLLDRSVENDRGPDDFEIKDSVEFVKRKMDSLPAKYQTILTLFYLQELSHEEIAEVTRLPIGTIKTHLYRARQSLQQLVQEEFELEKAV